MGHMGYFALGASVVCVANIVLKCTHAGRGHAIVVLALLPLCGAGAAVLWNPSVLATTSADYFPIGMLLAFCWLGMDNVLPGLASADPAKKKLSIWKVGGVSVLSILLILVLVFLDYISQHGGKP